MKSVKVFCTDGEVIIPLSISKNCLTLVNAMKDCIQSKESYNFSTPTFSQQQMKNFLAYKDMVLLNFSHNNANYYEIMLDYINISDYLEYDDQNLILTHIRNIFNIGYKDDHKFNKQTTSIEKLLSLKVLIQQEIFYYKTLDKFSKIKNTILKLTEEEKILQTLFFEKFEKENETEITRMLLKIEEYEKIYDYMLLEIFAKFVDKETRERNINSLMVKYNYNPREENIVYTYVRNRCIYKSVGYNVNFYFRPYVSLTSINSENKVEDFERLYEYPNNILFVLNDKCAYQAIGLLEKNNHISKIKFGSNQYYYIIRNNFEVCDEYLEYDIEKEKVKIKEWDISVDLEYFDTSLESEDSLESNECEYSDDSTEINPEEEIINNKVI